MTPIVVAHNVWKSFGAVPVLRGVSIEVLPARCSESSARRAAKEHVPALLNLLERIDHGDLFVNGEFAGYRFRDGRLYELRACGRGQRVRTGMVFQRFNLFAHMTALENVACGPTTVLKECRSAVQAEAASARAGGFVWSLRPLSIAIVRRPAATGGDRPCDRDAARALLFDEPTSALDSEWSTRCCGDPRPCRGGTHDDHRDARTGLCARRLRSHRFHG